RECSGGELPVRIECGHPADEQEAVPLAREAERKPRRQTRAGAYAPDSQWLPLVNSGSCCISEAKHLPIADGRAVPSFQILMQPISILGDAAALQPRPTIHFRSVPRTGIHAAVESASVNGLAERRDAHSSCGSPNWLNSE